MASAKLREAGADIVTGGRRGGREGTFSARKIDLLKRAIYLSADLNGNTTQQRATDQQNTKC